MSHAVIIKNAVKKYGDFTAVNGISLNIEQGEFFTLRLRQDHPAAHDRGLQHGGRGRDLL